MKSRSPRRTTVKDVAAAAGVAPMTVSYTFNHPARVAETTRERVLQAAAALGYRPDATARALRSGRTKQMGVVVGEHLSYLFDDPQAAQFLAGISDICVEDDLGVVLIPTRGDVSDVDRVLSAAVDGYVLWTTVTDDPVLAAIVESGRPAAIQGGPDHPGLTCVRADDRAAAAAVASMVMAPDTTPLVISFPLDQCRASGILRGHDLPDADAVGFPVTGARLAGYRDAVIAAGHDWSDVRIAVVERNQRAFGEEAARALLRTVEGPVAVLAMSDELALGARAATGLEPKICGWDGTREAAAARIWSVSASMREQGRACARAAVAGGGSVATVPWAVASPTP